MLTEDQKSARQKAINVALAEIHAIGLEEMKKNEERRILVDAIHAGRVLLSRNHVTSAATLFGSLHADMNAYNQFRENMVI